MKIKIDQDTCIGCGSCVSVCPEVFELDENGKAFLKNSKNPAEGEVTGKNSEVCAKEGADICPVEAIAVLEPEK